MAQQVDSSVISPKQECAFGADRLAAYEFLTTDPPAPIDLITIFEQNTQLTVISGLTAVRDVLKTGKCVDSATGMADNAVSTTILEEVGNLDSNESMSGSQHYLALPTVYHKLMLMCHGDDKGLFNNSGVCRGPHGALIPGYTGFTGVPPNDNPVFDLVTAADITKCGGEPCKAAARAVLAYQVLLADVTVLRIDTGFVVTGTPPAEPTYEQEKWTWQRSCDAMHSIVDKATTVTRRLPEVVSDLRAAAPQLAAACVVPSRDMDDIQTRAAAIIGQKRAAINRQVWETAQLKAADRCSGGILS